MAEIEVSAEVPPDSKSQKRSTDAEALEAFRWLEEKFNENDGSVLIEKSVDELGSMLRIEIGSLGGLNMNFEGMSLLACVNRYRNHDLIPKN